MRAIVLKLLLQALTYLAGTTGALLNFYAIFSAFYIIEKSELNDWLGLAALLTGAMMIFVIIHGVVIFADGYMRDEPYASNGNYLELYVRLWILLFFMAILTLCGLALHVSLAVATVQYGWPASRLLTYIISCALTLLFCAIGLWRIYYQITRVAARLKPSERVW